MRNDCSSPVAPFLGLPLKRYSSRRSLRQHQMYEPTIPRAVGQQQRSKSFESWRPSGGLGRSQRSTLVPKTYICPRDHPLRGDKLSQWWSSCRAFQHWQDKRIGRPKYYWPSLKKDVENYVRGCDVCLTSKAVRYKPYGDLQSLSIPIYW